MNPSEKLPAETSDPKWWENRALQCGLSLAAGLAVAVMLHYLLYRFGLPSRPFIYVAF